jgi:hypothetical protein
VQRDNGFMPRPPDDWPDEVYRQYMDFVVMRHFCRERTERDDTPHSLLRVAFHCPLSAFPRHWRHMRLKRRDCTRN